VKAEYVNPFIASTMAVFETMAATTLRRGTPFVKQGYQPSHEVSAVMGLSGKAKGTVVLSVDRDVAVRVAATMLQEDVPSSITPDVADAMGEMANMIAGQAKAQLNQFAMTLSLPTVITGKGHCIEFPKNAMRICVPFSCDWGSLCLEVALAVAGSAAETDAAEPATAAAAS
jgi:chemotaxis protein CheX